MILIEFLDDFVTVLVGETLLPTCPTDAIINRLCIVVLEPGGEIFIINSYAFVLDFITINFPNHMSNINVTSIILNIGLENLLISL